MTTSEGHDRPVTFTKGEPETVLPALDPALTRLLADAAALPAGERRAALATIAMDHPRCLQAWAALAALDGPLVDRYAFARVGYHRGLDALRGSGWRGSGRVRWTHPENHGFLMAVAALADAASHIGEADEADRCRTFLRQLDPDSSGPPSGS